MIWRILKKLLSVVSIYINYTEGDQIHLKLEYGGKVILDKKLDIMPNF